MAEHAAARFRRRCNIRGCGAWRQVYRLKRAPAFVPSPRTRGFRTARAGAIRAAPKSRPAPSRRSISQRLPHRPGNEATFHRRARWPRQRPRGAPWRACRPSGRGWIRRDCGVRLSARRFGKIDLPRGRTVGRRRPPFRGCAAPCRSRFDARSKGSFVHEHGTWFEQRSHSGAADGRPRLFASRARRIAPTSRFRLGGRKRLRPGFAGDAGRARFDFPIAVDPAALRQAGPRQPTCGRAPRDGRPIDAHRCRRPAKPRALVSMMGQKFYGLAPRLLARAVRRRNPAKAVILRAIAPDLSADAAPRR
jgi:hypothetical protein